MMGRGKEGDLGRMRQQLADLRLLGRVAGQTEKQYRAAIANHVKGLLDICRQPDAQAVLSQGRKDNAKNSFIFKLRRLNDETISGIDKIPGFAPPILGIDVVDRGSGYRRGPYEYTPFYLDVNEVSKKSLCFFIEFTIIEREDRSNQPETKLWLGQRIADRLNTRLQLDPTIEWQKRQMIDPRRSNDHPNIFFSKRVTIEDFTRHPEWLEQFNQALTVSLERAHGQTNSQIQQQQRRIEQFTTPPIREVVKQLRAGTDTYSRDELSDVAQNAAESVLKAAPPLPETVSEERVRMIVAEMIRERLVDLQSTPQRKGNPAEGIWGRFRRRSRDPKRVSEALLDLSGLIPGNQQITAILKAVNTMFGPEEMTK